ncbi:rRNA methyltransferase [Streptomyces sp. CoH27]|uniref:rRNA methyltransferase n=1 Tax=Streptomyces sp. CoH27 TaxID=2875763 RepID=UPI001CD67BB3|nr:rRNA methyltransferase [Streptomyces sp. CoH27]
MSYRFATERTDDSDLASGVVLHSAPGYPAYPARLAVEIFRRALAHTGTGRPVTLWDPCCGSGHLATVLGWLERPAIGQIVCSDVDTEAITLARKNLALLTEDGLAARERQRLEQSERFGKPAYQEAAAAARRRAVRLAADGGSLPWRAGQADAFDPTALRTLLSDIAPDLVITDVPYGERTHWGGGAPELPIPALLRALAAVLPPHAVVAVSNRGRKIPVAPLRPLERLKIGTRSVVLLRAGDIGHEQQP